MRFTLYSRSYCHLCEDMLAALQALAPARAAVRGRRHRRRPDPALVARFDELVPVLFGRLDEPELCHYFLDEAAVRTCLEPGIGGSGIAATYPIYGLSTLKSGKMPGLEKLLSLVHS